MVKYFNIICLFIGVFCTSQVSSQFVVRARAIISNGNATGIVTITETLFGLLYTGSISGLTPGRHGFHVHVNGITTGCASAGAHYNPFNRNHGAPSDAIRHVGDLGNIVAATNGLAVIFLYDGVTNLRGVNTIINRSIVVHQDQDDLGRGGFPDSLTTGHAGARVGCGTIRQIGLFE